MSELNGWIKIHRKIRKHWIFDNAHYLKAWIIMILECNHVEKKVLIEGDLIPCKRGQSVKSISSWEKLFGKGWSRQRVRTFFSLLKKDNMINLEGLRKTTRLTILNYNTYQDHLTNSQPTANQQLTNSQPQTRMNKNVKNEKNKRFIAPKPNEVSEYAKSINFDLDGEYFCDWYQARGWKYKSGQPMVDWKAAVRTWKRSNYGKEREPIQL